MIHSFPAAGRVPVGPRAPQSLPGVSLRSRSCCQASTSGQVPNGNGSTPPDSGNEGGNSVYGVPSYLQSYVEESDLCDSWGALMESVEYDHTSKGTSDSSDSNYIWATIRAEAEREAAQEPLLSSFLYASILSHRDFQHSLAFVLSNRLANNTLLPTQLFDLIMEVMKADPLIAKYALADLQAFQERDPACDTYSCALLHFKGYHALQAHRVAHALWEAGRAVMASTIQSRTSEVFAVDIHPGATIGRGVLMDHGTGVVVGETAVVGNYVSMLQGVTLGGTGKTVGDRHPKVRDNVLIGAHATILGNITLGEGSQIASGSLVLKDVAPHTIMAGAPANCVGEVEGNPAKRMQHWVQNMDLDFADELFCSDVAQAEESQAADGREGDSSGSNSSSSSEDAGGEESPTRGPKKVDLADWDI